MIPAPFRDVWASLHEPRVITVLHVSFYVAMCVAGAAMIVLVPFSTATPAVTWVGVLAIVATLLSGAIGSLAAWRGRWYEERVACLLGCLAAILNVGLSAALYLLMPPFAHEQLFAVVTILGLYGVLVMFAVRYLRVREAPWPPGREPQQARDVAAVRGALASASPTS